LDVMDINGKWYNELGSEVEFRLEGNQVTGQYHTAVGDATGVYPLVGQLNASLESGQAIGFVVVWQNEHKDSNSVTCWSGQAQTVDGVDLISTTWLLTSETDVSEFWESTLVGKDVFKREPYEKAGVKQGAPAFPKAK
uniref:avidin/streptavidin family protein n=1 Tax=Hymenobacter sp. AT01-02 TaxID=1571877 RepID=UPI0006E45D12